LVIDCSRWRCQFGLSRRWSGDFSKTRFSGLRELDDQPQDPVEFKRSAMATYI
jgi:hypothetical protein